MHFEISMRSIECVCWSSIRLFSFDSQSKGFIGKIGSSLMWILHGLPLNAFASSVDRSFKIEVSFFCTVSGSFAFFRFELGWSLMAWFFTCFRRLDGSVYRFLQPGSWQPYGFWNEKNKKTNSQLKHPLCIIFRSNFKINYRIKVCSLVFCTIWTVAEHFGTSIELASIWPFAGVRSLMNFQIFQSGERFIATLKLLQNVKKKCGKLTLSIELKTSHKIW